MKPAPFDYHAPRQLKEAAELLATLPNAKILAGGQSLVPMMNFRYVVADHLIDLGGISDLRGIAVVDGWLRIGAMMRQRELETAPEVAQHCPLLADALRHVGHRQTRNRGTIGGSLAHADPAAELPGIAMTCEAKIAVLDTAGGRVIEAADFFRGPLMTALKPDEIITEMRLPAWPSKRHFGFEEFARRQGDFALAGAALFYDEDGGGKATNAHVGAFGVADRPLRLTAVERVLNGSTIDEATIVKAEAAACAVVDPPDDIHAGGAYRKALVGVMVERALRSASA
jgi:aerobic carbon-monoxide dehydrogenase medium subunit